MYALFAVDCDPRAISQQRQYLYFCTSKASKVSTRLLAHAFYRHAMASFGPFDRLLFRLSILARGPHLLATGGTQCTCFTGTKVQILTQLRESQHRGVEEEE